MKLFENNKKSNASYYNFFTDKGTKFKLVLAFDISNFVEVSKQVLNEIIEEHILIGGRLLEVGDKVTCFGNSKKNIRSFQVKESHYLEYQGYINGGFSKNDARKILLFKCKDLKGKEQSSTLLDAFTYINDDCLITHSIDSIIDFRALDKSVYLI